jgi:hypothetical protein
MEKVYYGNESIDNPLPRPFSLASCGIVAAQRVAERFACTNGLEANHTKVVTNSHSSQLRAGSIDVRRCTECQELEALSFFIIFL